jgi:hypothetical protein
MRHCSALWGYPEGYGVQSASRGSPSLDNIWREHLLKMNKGNLGIFSRLKGTLEIIQYILFYRQGN